MTTLFLMLAALVVDGGYAFAQRRSAQNASDLASLAAVKQIATAGATDAQVQSVITTTAQANNATVLFGLANNGPQYFDKNGVALGYVGSFAGSGPPAGAVAVSVPSTITFRPFLASVVGFNSWKAGATATARGVSNAEPPAGALFPVGISAASFDQNQAGHMTLCPTGTAAGTGPGQCAPTAFTDGGNNVPGGKSWLKFGCDGYGLGQGNNGGCDNSKPFLQDEIGPPSDSFGCCTAVGLSGSPDQIGSVPGNKASADCNYYITNHIVVMVPVWDTAGGNGSNGWYHIVGYAGFELTKCDGGKDVEGVWRSGLFTSPTGTPPPPPGPPLTIQLLK
jgi:hypothetical protein